MVVVVVVVVQTYVLLYAASYSVCASRQKVGRDSTSVLNLNLSLTGWLSLWDVFQATWAFAGRPRVWAELKGCRCHTKVRAPAGFRVILSGRRAGRD